MRNSRVKKESGEQRNSQIVNIMNLKLQEIRNHEKGPLPQSFGKNHPSNINTPSTLANSKNYYSCELSRPRTDSHQKKSSDPQPPLQLQPHISATKILTLTEIKHQSRLNRAEDDPKKGHNRSSSQKLFVSIAKSNRSKQKRYEPEIKQVDCKMLQGQPTSVRQKLKINVYKDMARKRNGKYQ